MVSVEQNYDAYELFDENKHLASSTLYHTLGNPHEIAKSKGIDLEDLVQIASMGLWDACLTYDESKSQFQTHAINRIKWNVFSALTNDFNVFKYPKNRIPEEKYTISSFDEPVGVEEGSSDLHEFVSDSEADSVEDLATIDALIDSLSDTLSNRQKKIIRLKYEGWMNADIADELGVSRQAVGQALRAIKETLKNNKKYFQ